MQRQTIWPTKAKIFTLQPFTEKCLLIPGLKGLLKVIELEGGRADISTLLCSFKAPNGRGWVARGASVVGEGREQSQLCSSGRARGRGSRPPEVSREVRFFITSCRNPDEELIFCHTHPWGLEWVQPGRDGTDPALWVPLHPCLPHFKNFRPAPGPLNWSLPLVFPPRSAWLRN